MDDAHPNLPEMMTPISQHIWNAKYRYNNEGLTHTWDRVASALADVEKMYGIPDDQVKQVKAKFRRLLSTMAFLPGGRILANAGTGRTSTTMVNCFVMNAIEDSTSDLKALMLPELNQQRAAH
jgi:ribonucleoside-diphosphate reductase alpha chain